MGEATKAAASAAAKSWRTTLAGWAAGLAILAHQVAVALDDDPATAVSFELVAAGLGMLGVGLFARDSGVTSEQAGANP